MQRRSLAKKNSGGKASKGKGSKQTDAQAGEGLGSDTDEGVPIDVAPDVWHIMVAGTLSRLGLQLQKALLEEKIIAFVVEWCETPHRKNAGVAYKDTCILYDDENDAIRNVTRSPANNIYIRVPHPLMDPVLELSLIHI